MIMSDVPQKIEKMAEMADDRTATTPSAADDPAADIADQASNPDETLAEHKPVDQGLLDDPEPHQILEVGDVLRLPYSGVAGVIGTALILRKNILHGHFPSGIPSCAGKMIMEGGSHFG